MTERKFTLPTEFPTEYITGDGRKVVILGRAHVGDYPLIGYVLYAEGGSDWRDFSSAEGWTEDGQHFIDWPGDEDNLYDIPKRITTWHNVYKAFLAHQCSSRSQADDVHNSIGEYFTGGRLCVYRIERDEDGSNPEIFVEEV